MTSFKRVAMLSAHLALAACFIVCGRARGEDATSNSVEPLVMVVMDPLAKPLSCPCVQGYAQRDYDKLAEALGAEIGRPVKVAYKESLVAAMTNDTDGKAHLVIGKHSVVTYDAERSKMAATAIGKLTDKQGETTMTGLVIVPTGDSATRLSELIGYRLVFGPEECDEKHAAAVALLKENGIVVPTELETSPACDEGAIWILDDAKQNKHGAAVISSYAKPLLEGCGTVEKGSLRVIGETKPVPFIEAFVTDQVAEADQQALVTALLKVTEDPELRIALESQSGFVAMGDEPALAKKKD
jgi:ABC-type phosphate/phosphonate transport system substrate-binding protein